MHHPSHVFIPITIWKHTIVILERQTLQCNGVSFLSVRLLSHAPANQKLCDHLDCSCAGGDVQTRWSLSLTLQIARFTHFLTASEGKVLQLLLLRWGLWFTSCGSCVYIWQDIIMWPTNQQTNQLTDRWTKRWADTRDLRTQGHAWAQACSASLTHARFCFAGSDGHGSGARQHLMAFKKHVSKNSVIDIHTNGTFMPHAMYADGERPCLPGSHCFWHTVWGITFTQQTTVLIWGRAHMLGVFNHSFPWLFSFCK